MKETDQVVEMSKNLRTLASKITQAADILDGKAAQGSKQPHRVISAQGRKRIAAAQKARWAKKRAA